MAPQFDAGESVTLAQTGLRGITLVLTFEHSEPEYHPRRYRNRRHRLLAALAEELLAGSGG